MNAINVDDPSLIFSLIKDCNFTLIEELIDDKKIDANLEDSFGNDVVMRLVKAREYHLALKLMKKKNWDVNHQNQDGNTLGHILAHDNSINAIQVVEELLKNKNYLSNIRNNRGETTLDIAINNNYLCTAFKILEDKRFNSINYDSFKNLFNATVSNKLYGKYSKISNLETIITHLNKKELDNELTDLIDYMNNNIESIKNTILNDNIVILDSIVNNKLLEM